MKYLILTLTVFANAQAFAAAAEKVEDLGTEVEAEQMEIYDQKQINIQARKETEALTRETHALEKKMQQLLAEGKTLNERIGNQQEHFAKVAKLARETEGQARKLQAQRDRLKSRLDVLKARTDQAHSRMQSAEDLNRNLSKELRDQDHEMSQLLGRQRAAEERIQRAARDTKRLRSEQRRVSVRNTGLQQKVEARESRANSKSVAVDE